MQGPTYSLANYFKGLENAEAVSRIFGARTEAILRNFKVQFAWIGGCVWVNGATGHLIISSRYLKEGDKTEIHLDLTHELVHVNSWAKEKNYSTRASATLIDPWTSNPMGMQLKRQKNWDE